MGCASSKIQSEDAVWQCGQRKSFVKQAVVARTALAASHSRYLQALSSTSLALKSFGENGGGEHQNPEEDALGSSSASVAASSSVASIESLEVPEEIPRKTTALRLWNTPTEPITVILSPPRRSPPEEHFIRGGGSGGAGDSSPPPPPPPPPVSEWEYFDIFHPPAAVRRIREMPDDEEDIPALEFSDEEVIRASLNRAKNKGVVIEELVEEERSDGGSSSGESDAAAAAAAAPGHAVGGSAAAAAGDGVASTSSSSAASSDENAPGGSSSKQQAGSAGIELGEVLRKLEDQFLSASEAGKVVSTTLEARKIHKQLERGFSDHSSRLLSALSLGHWSPRELNSPRSGLEGEESGGTSGSHAATLDRLYAWEKKLFEEVKAWETINSELARKRKLLRNLDAKGAKADVIDKTRASMKALETEISVAVHAMEASSSEIQRISDDEVLPQLLELLKDLAEMWEKMHKCHEEQLGVVMQLKLGPENPITGASSPQRNATAQLEAALVSWQTSLSAFIQAQKDYVRNLGSWIKSSIHNDQANSRRNKKPVPKIQHLCEKWAASLEKLSPGELNSKIKDLSDALKQISGRQAEEIRIQKRAEALSKELNRKYMSLNSNGGGGGEKKKLSDTREKQAAIDSLRRKVGEEQERLSRAALETRAYTLQGLQLNLPPLFLALESFAGECSLVHRELFTEVESYSVVAHQAA